ncbi:receptor-type tyrosine-protein phosphatase F isoform X12 [Neopelma chrysocephalum]|uniref:Receptor-type tyrosine-protein phosphatase F n=1 Tax=Lepidothrix coronata TaxID=321398 RepID=A0A6J0I234_9PASS|nr:PREDICTED: receptor-type tyrosine-protein phosphatase F isoform X13 [Lepidothrix coronata]XP_017927706.1 receptor-type tyrosine-protein phosphatase F isoform X6 [Manacus vitellinus]XP_027539097.1 receptor-type tyrosine-protein phosphatase F isoform X12 [Neopelma chrysocephalum]XP_051653013.1 receptor-type tyrosine-protein phosphatase F isoform X6 [Manacus candei]
MVPNFCIPVLTVPAAILCCLMLPSAGADSKPTFMKAPEDQIGISGGVASFVCQATGEPKPRITWMKKGKKVSSQRFEVIEFDDGSGSVLRIQPLRVHRDEAIYECTATNSVGEINTSAKLTVLEEDHLPAGFPTIDMGPQLKVVEKARTATMLCAASGNPDPEISWFKDFLPVDTATSNGRIKQLRSGALQIENSEESDQGKYECVATNSAGTRYSAPANLYVRVRRVAPRFSIPPSNHEVMPGGSVNLTCVAVGAPMPYVKWMAGVEELTKEDEMPVGRNVLELTNIMQSANYTCVAISSLGMIEATAQISVKALPKPPTEPSVTETTATSVTLTWDSGNSDPITYYVIQYKPKSLEGQFQEVDGVATTRYSIGGLSPFSEYEFRVIAVNNIGRGPPSELVEARTGEQAPSSPPLKVQARMLSASTMLVQWEQPEEPNGQIRGYRVYYTTDPHLPLSMWQKHNTDDSHLTTVGSLITGTTYSIRVLAFTSVGDGPPSDIIQVKTQQGVPAQPADFQAEAESDTRILLTWLPASQERITKYELLYWEGEDGTQQKVEFDPTSSYAVEGLKPDTLYKFRLGARSELGVGVYTPTIEARTAQSMPSAPPRKVEVESVNSTAIRVSWKLPISNKQHGQIRGYQVTYVKLENNEPRGQPVIKDVMLSEAQETVIGGLLPETTYSVTVAAYTTKGDGARSKPKVITTTGAVPGKPTMMISTTAMNTALIQWHPPKEMVGELLGYRLQYRRLDEEKMNTIDFGKRDHHYTVTNLHKGATYLFRLSAKNRAGPGEEFEKEITTAEDVPSGFPQNLRVVGLTTSTTEVAWDPPVLAERNGKIVNYTVVYRDINSQQDLVNLTRDTSITLTNLKPDTTYDIKVRARTSKGAGPLSPSIQSRTMPVEQVFAKNFRVNAVMKTSVLLSWEVPDSYKSAVPFKILYNSQSVEVDGHSMKKLISDLQPDTDYSFVLMNRGSSAGGLQHLVSIRTAPDVLQSKPIATNKYIQEGKFTLTLPKVQTTVPVRWYYIVVVPADQSTSTPTARWRTPDEMELDQLLEAINQGSQSRRQRRQADRLKPYIAAQVDVLPETFTLGDEKNYKGFYNKPLSQDLSYRCFVLASLEDGDTKRYAASPYSDEIVMEVASAKQQDEPEMLWVMGPVLAVILIIIIVIAILLFKRKRAHSPSSKDEHSIGLKDSLLAHSSDPVEMRRLNYQTPGMRDHPPIPVSDLADNIDRLKANDGLKFSQEYESIDPGQQFTWENSNLEVNKPKNRYANVIAYDHSRVILTSIDGVPGSDYINANYIDGYRKQNAYIATQGPLPETLSDFWRMVWEQRTATIVMMTRLEEKSRVKCDQYWPSRGTETYGMIQVTLLDTVELATYTVRTFALYKNGSSEKRELRQFQFMAWPDHGVPEYPTPILAFLRRVKACNPPDAGPMVVHCSAGVGRTGCFIVIDAMLERMKHEKTVDIYGHVTCMRSQRNYMVQTEDQYIFIHEALLEAATCGNTEVPARNLFAHIQKLTQVPAGESVTSMELEFKLLANSKAHTSRFISANLPCNKFKNRLVNIMPYELTRVCLQPIRGVEGSDYINASFIDGYRQQKAYIATQGPLAETTEDFWRMLWEHNSTIVVMLTKLREMGREKCHQYWPAERSARYQYFVVDPMAEYNMPQYILREFKVTDARDGQSRTIRQFQFTDWPEQGVPKTGEGFIDFIGQVHKTKEQFGQDGPITVHCSAGVGRTGVFITLSIVLERMRYEGVVDMFQMVKTLRTQRPAMVQTEDQYQLCYRAALEYLGSFDHYAT